ncbi:protein NLP6-like [Camellia sinensis]|uniref:protein NLP6-like n=1 Tax=Camellia sinensis TaxID=4442 RepID=UPI001036D558|nr:protein NLP6-like [Camellia sinensis]
MADAEGKYVLNLPDDFKEYMYKELNFWPLHLFYLSEYLYGGVFWSREDDEPQRPSTLPDGDISNLNKIIRHLLSRIIHWTLCPMLVQFWAPITTKEGRPFLTTRNQPFSLSSCFYDFNIEGLCGYRMICMDSKGPLAHHARKAGLSGCFAICLESNYIGNDVYVLEFFMPMSNNASENPHTSLRKILETMRENFRCLRVASRELWEKLHIEEISIQNGEKLDPVQNPQTTISLPQLELSQSEVEVIQVDSSDQQLVNAINTGSNVGNTEHNNFAITFTQEKSTVKVSKRKGNKSGGTVKTSKRDGNNIGVKIKIPLEDILQNSELSLENAAKSLKVSKSTLKRVCRTFGIERWPPRKMNKVGCSQLDESAQCVNSDHLPSTQSSATIVHTEPHDKTMQDANIVTVKAKYGEGITMKFRLSLSSRFVQLQQEVAKRLNLKAGTYYVKYEDEDGELILIGCDEDLQDYMRDSRSLGRSSIVVLLEQKLPITDHKKNKK